VNIQCFYKRRTFGFRLLSPLIVLAILCPALMGPASADSPIPGNKVPGWAESTARLIWTGQVKSAWLRIMAFTDAPVVGADVRVYLHSHPWPSIEVPAATNNQGVFSVAVPKSLFQSGSRIRVAVSGGTRNGNPFLGHLSADALLTDPAHQIVVVNPVTTLVSLLSEARRDLELEDAKEHVRSFLGLPEGYDIGLALRESSGYGSPFFSPAVLLAEAERAEGFDGFLARLVQELMASRSAKRPFLNTMPQAPGGAAVDAAKFVAKNLAAGVLRYLAGQGVGWAVQATGLTQSGATEDDIATLQQSLADLQSSVDSLSSQVAQLSLLVQSTATQTLYNAIVVPASELAAQVTAVQNRLQYFAQECPPLAEGSPPTPPSNYCTTEKDAIIAELNDVTIFTSYDVLVDWVQDNPTTGFRGMLHLYSLWLAQSKGFFRAADSTKMQNLYDYWDTVLTTAANLRIELLHQEGEQDEGGTQLIALMGNPDLSPPTTGEFQANQDANLELMFPPVPSGTVISTADHTMWALLPYSYSGGDGGTFYPTDSCTVEAYWWRIIYPSWVAQGFAGFSDWIATPTRAMWEAALTRAPSIDTGTSWEQWIVTETQADAPESPTSPGFRICETQNSFNWTNTTSSGSLSDSNAVCYVVSLASSKFLTSHCYGAYDYGNISYPVRALKPDEQYFWYQ